MAIFQERKDTTYPYAKEIEEPAGFINTDKITIGELVGKKVVLIDFWTYSCINCQRTLPHLQAWYEKYKDKGLEIIGIHTPEFEFEKKYENVLWAVKKFGVSYPVVLDNTYGTWYEYDNRYWPAKYLIDINGCVVWAHFGEGAYEETERKIQELLEERAKRFGIKAEIPHDIACPKGVLGGDLRGQRSPEIYFGALRNEYLGNGKSGKRGIQNLIEPTGMRTNILYLVGEWEFHDEFAENKSANAKIIFRYQAKDVYMVASSESEHDIFIALFRDEQSVRREGGHDLTLGRATIKEARLYTLIQDPTGWGEHTLEIVVEQPGLRAYTFTFG